MNLSTLCVLVHAFVTAALLATICYFMFKGGKPKWSGCIAKNWMVFAVLIVSLLVLVLALLARLTHHGAKHVKRAIRESDDRGYDGYDNGRQRQYASEYT